MAANGPLRDDLIIAALAVGLSYEQAAGKAGCSARTVRRRMEDCEFRAAVVENRRVEVDRMRASLVGAAPAAIETLRALAASARSESVRLGAARAIVTTTLSPREMGLDVFSLQE